MILVNIYKDGEIRLSFSVDHFGVDYRKKCFQVVRPGVETTYHFKTFNHNHITGSDYHILSIEVDNEKEQNPAC